MGKGADKPKQTAAEKASQDIAWKQWGDVKTRFLPLERKVAEVATDKSLRRDNELAAVTAGGSMAFSGCRDCGGSMAFSGSREGIAKAAGARGINPNSGAVSDAVATAGDAQGAGTGGAAVGIVQDRETRVRTGATNVIATGREVEGQSMAAYNTLGGIQQRKQQLIDQAEQYERAAYGRAAGQAIGLGVGMSMGPKGISDDQLIAAGGSPGARNAYQHIGAGMVP